MPPRRGSGRRRPLRRRRSSSAPQRRRPPSGCPVPGDGSQPRRPPIGCLRPRWGIAARAPDLVLGEPNPAAAAAPGRGAESRRRPALRRGPEGEGTGRGGGGDPRGPASPAARAKCLGSERRSPRRAGPSGSPELGASNARRGDGSEDVRLPPLPSYPEAPQQPASLRPPSTVALAAAAAHAGQGRPRSLARSWSSSPPPIPALWSRPAPDGDPGLPRARPPGRRGWERVPQVWPAPRSPTEEASAPAPSLRRESSAGTPRAAAAQVRRLPSALPQPPVCFFFFS
ncbi:basic salivary proline-rich protein 1-like [Peromyscus eremicus]|uniref:basic salivary proline-rich protein 1-like n=1 Tax=Peromyscus eremicus TaxID=42410 RepID=UPI0027DC5283|nr:basic salivary proline-rich protein 1-like [Peromyscus eremicus]